MSSVGSNTIAIANCASMVLGTMISLSFQKVKIIKFYRKHFVPIVAIEVIGFAIVSFGGINYPAMRNWYCSTKWFYDSHLAECV